MYSQILDANRNVFRAVLKLFTDEELRMEHGSWFHAVGPATTNVLSPNFVLVCWNTRSPRADDRVRPSTHDCRVRTDIQAPIRASLCTSSYAVWNGCAVKQALTANAPDHESTPLSILVAAFITRCRRSRAVPIISVAIHCTSVPIYCTSVPIISKTLPSCLLTDLLILFGQCQVMQVNRGFLTVYTAKVIIVPHRIIWSWYTGRWRVGCYMWYRDKGTGRGGSKPRLLLAVPNVTADPSTASVPITVLLHNG